MWQLPLRFMGIESDARCFGFARPSLIKMACWVLKFIAPRVNMRSLFSKSSSDTKPNSDARRRFSLFSFGSGSLPDAPPPYDEVAGVKSTKYFPENKPPRLNKRRASMENDLETLRRYDTVILVDDSLSMTMCGSKRGVTRWQEASNALADLAPAAQQYDSDGIDIHFLNHPRAETGLKTSDAVRKVFDSVTPDGFTPTGDRLHQLLSPYLTRLTRAKIRPDGTPVDRETGKEIKRMNLIVITDGAASDDPKTSIIHAAKCLMTMPELCLVQLGIQFVQIGNDAKATKSLQILDDELHKAGDIPDIVDTTPYHKLHPVTARGLVKVLAGGINRRIDAQKIK
ncbi:hypothetical protein MSAN_00559500 [Mycena sanguinolenta]|uniref:VWFA domain-containing protein n=1 Tax=Mycena sanguinolenta TaxID=230812 RepID=A0A8H7DJE4_9AGAR|nr:hypothetical protein MSAN_00559500 [Mycena sanguinolenta]